MKLMEDLQNRPAKPTFVHEDNQSAICIAQSPRITANIKYHIVREKVLDSTTELKYCPTSDMLDDIILTKGLTYDKFSRLCDRFGVKDPSAYK